MSLTIDAAQPPRPAWKSWTRALAAFLLAAAVLMLALGAGFGAGMLFDAWAGVDQPRAYGAGEAEALTAARLATFLIAFQVVTVLLTLVAAATIGARDEPLVRYGWPAGGLRTLLLAFAALIVIAAIYAVLVFNLNRPAFVHDIGPFAQLMRTQTWWLLLIAAGIGAPIAEETLFRGFLYGALRDTPAGKIAAALATSTMWAALHGNYSVYGLAAIAVIGLYLTFLRERTRSLATPIFCHACYNGLIVLVLASPAGETLVAG